MTLSKAFFFGVKLLLAGISVMARAQDATPIASFYSLDESSTVKMTSGDSQTAQAPLDVALTANVNNPENYNYVCEWRVWNTKNNE